MCVTILHFERVKNNSNDVAFETVPPRVGSRTGRCPICETSPAPSLYFCLHCFEKNNFDPLACSNCLPQSMFHLDHQSHGDYGLWLGAYFYDFSTVSPVNIADCEVRPLRHNDPLSRALYNLPPAIRILDIDIKPRSSRREVRLLLPQMPLDSAIAGIALRIHKNGLLASRKDEVMQQARSPLLAELLLTGMTAYKPAFEVTLELVKVLHHQVFQGPHNLTSAGSYQSLSKIVLKDKKAKGMSRFEEHLFPDPIALSVHDVYGIVVRFGGLILSKELSWDEAAPHFQMLTNQCFTTSIAGIM